MKSKIIAMILGAISAITAYADVKCADIFSDHMVLQANMPIRIWGSADAGEKINVKFMNLKGSAVAGADGKWRVDLPAPKKYVKEGQELVVEGKNKLVFKDVLVGEVWVCLGQSNMDVNITSMNDAKEFLDKNSNLPLIRYYFIPKATSATPRGAHDLKDAQKWLPVTPENRKQFSKASAVGSKFAVELFENLNVPIGYISAAVGGSRLESWMTREAADAAGETAYVERMEKLFDEWQARDIAKWEALPAEEKAKRNKPDNRCGVISWCHNAMVAPLIPLSMRGEIWYQGEMNNGTHDNYINLFPEYAKMMRKFFENENLYIFTVQLPDSTDKGWAPLRNVQRKLGDMVEKSGVAIIIDGGDTDLHPKDKTKPAHRLAIMALADVYGKKIISRSPMPLKLSQKGDFVSVVFKNVGKGLKISDGQGVRCFEVAGEDGKFYDAEAKIASKNSVKITLPSEVSSVKKVRYAWAPDPDVNLYNSADLPASPFEEPVE